MRALLALSIITSSLIAGLFYAYTCSVNPGLHQLPDDQYIAAMQAINIAIQNGLFFISFFGAMFFLPLSAYMAFSRPFTRRFQLLFVAAVVYIIGVLGVTIFGNIPLNEALAVFDMRSATAAEITHQRVQFEGPWNAFHAIRTTCAVLAEVLVVFACLTTEATSSNGR